jgi:ethanolamine-phosphate phospho-lyase
MKTKICRDIDHPNEDLGVLYANEVKEIIEKMKAQGKKPSAFIAESLQSCGGKSFVKISL